MTPQPLEVILNAQKASIVRDIVAFGDTDDRRRQLRTLLDNLETVQRALVAAGENPNRLRYVAARKPIDAIVQYLEDVQEPQAKDDIIDGVLAGGWRGGGREQRQWLSICIEVFLSPTATGAKGKRSPLKRWQDRIGLKDWDQTRWS